MRLILISIFSLIILTGCGVKSDPEYQANFIKQISLKKNK